MYFNHSVSEHTNITVVLISYRFYNCLQHALERETDSHPKEKINKKSNSYSHKKKKKQGKASGKCTTEENDKELENDDDLEISVTIFPEDY